MVESQPSKLLVASSILVSRSISAAPELAGGKRPGLQSLKHAGKFTPQT